MATIEDLQIIMDRFTRSPVNLARVELEMFRRTIEQDPILWLPIERIMHTSGDMTGSKVATLIKDPQGSIWGDLHFAAIPELRALVGYQFLIILLESCKKTDEFVNKIISLGRYYWAYLGLANQNPSFLDCLKVLAGIFLDPLIIYLRSGMAIEEKLMSVLGRYRQRAEWFGLEVEYDPADHELEQKLKKDLLKYLFDSGFDFSVESQIPSGGGKVDILPIIAGWGQLPVEVKVFDGRSRPHQNISSGLAQAADYARKFSKPTGYYIVFNLKQDSVLNMPGAKLGSNITKTNMQGVEVITFVSNLRMTIPSSHAAHLETIDVPPP